MKSYLIAACCLAIVPVTGCVSMGPNFDPEVVSQLQPGADKAEVIAKLGRPTSTARLADGREELSWVYSHGTMLGTGNSRIAVLMFGADGKYVGPVSQAETTIR